MKRNPSPLVAQYPAPELVSSTHGMPHLPNMKELIMTLESIPTNNPYSRLKHVQAAIDRQIGENEKKRTRAQRQSRNLTILQLFALALTPVALGVSNMNSFDWYTLIGLVLSAVSMLCGSILATFGSTERWKGFVRVSGNLQEMKLTGELLATKQELVSEEEVRKLREDFQGVLGAGNDRWQKSMRPQKSNGV